MAVGPVGTAFRSSLAAVLVLVCLGCGEEGRASSRAVDAVSPTPSTGPTQPSSDLAIEIRDPGGRWRLLTLTCDPAGGSHPMADLACRALESADDPFSPA